MTMSLSLRRAMLVSGCVLMVAGTPGYAQQAINLPPALRASLDRSVNPAQRIQVTDPEGREITEETRAQVRDGAVVLAPPANRPFIVRLEQVERMALPVDQARVALPGGLVMPGPRGTLPAWSQVTVGASPSPAVWDEARRRYTTRLWFGLRASDHASPDLVPDRPVAVRLDFLGLNAEPVEALQLERPGLEYERPVDLHFMPTTASPTLQVRSNLTSVDVALEVLPRLELRPVHLAVPGLGLGTVNVVVAHVLPYGDSAPATRDVPVSLTIDGGALLDQPSVVIREGDTQAQFTLRSSGLGEVTVRARAGALSDSTTIQQTFPLFPLLAGLFGGGLGGFARSFMPRARRRSTPRRVLEGLVVASIAYVAAVLGVAQLGLPAVGAATEAGAFLTGALAGFIGVAVIEQLTRGTSPARTPA